MTYARLEKRNHRIKWEQVDGLYRARVLCGKPSPSGPHCSGLIAVLVLCDPPVLRFEGMTRVNGVYRALPVQPLTDKGEEHLIRYPVNPLIGFRTVTLGPTLKKSPVAECPRAKSTERIDPIVAMVMALDRASRHAEEKEQLMEAWFA